MTRLYLTLLAPLILLDCAGNVILTGGSFHSTLSATAWSVRSSPYFGWTHKLIDALFFWQDNHCEMQYLREWTYGSVWAAWAYSWRRG